MREPALHAQVSEEGQGGAGPGSRAEVPLQPMVETMKSQAVPLHPLSQSGPVSWFGNGIPNSVFLLKP